MGNGLKDMWTVSVLFLIIHVYLQLLQNEKFNLKKITLSNYAIIYKEEKQITGAYDWKGPLGERMA